MKLCGQKSKHSPHCTKCNTLVAPAIFRQEEQVVIILNCENCRTEKFICADVTGLEKVDRSDRYQLRNRAVAIARKNTDRCYFDLGCENMPIDAHSIPKNWIELIEGPRVLIFHGRVPSNHDPSKPPPIPRGVSKKVASTSRFVCDPHDKFFYDSREYLTEADRESLNMLFFRAVLQKHHSEVLDANFISAFANPFYGSSYPDEALRLITLASESIREYKDDPAHDYRFVHLVKYLRGKPAVACSNAGMWPLEFYTNPLTNRAVEIPISSPIAWGRTVIPTSTDELTGHIVVAHYCSLIPDREYARYTVEFIKGKLKLMSSLEGEEAEQLISANILGLTEMLCVSQEQWETFSSEKRRLMDPTGSLAMVP